MSRAPDTNLVGGELLPCSARAPYGPLVPIEALTALAVVPDQA